MRISSNEAGKVFRRLFCIPLVIVFLVAGGCGTNLAEFYFEDLFGKGPSSTVDKTAEQLAVEGMQKMQKKEYGDALKDFRKLKENYPYSKYAALAELKIGDALFYDKKYGEAAIAYEEFARLHPRNEVIPYVLYQVGMSHFLSFSTPDRDPEETRLAMEAFARVIQGYPDSEYASRARKQMFECQKRIVAHEYNVGKFYYRLEEYHAAMPRLEKIQKEYPKALKELGYEKDVEKMLARCEKECAKGEKKPSIWVRLGF
jgi:outer membrane protein assembly factor BamD